MHNLVKQKEQLQQQQQLPSPLQRSWRPNNNNNNNYLYGEDSLEIAPSESVDDEIFDQSDLAERIIDAEKKFSTSSITTSYFASEYFEHPALYRVLFMGSTTEDKKKELFKKLSQGFVHVLQQQQHIRPTPQKNLSLLGQPIIPFKEIKHNILLLSDDDEPNLISDTCEDIGVSMIEADFTWNSNAVNYSNDPNNLLLQYAWHQCPNPRELPLAWLENQIFLSKTTKFTGYMYPERTPNGIDLCVYFYDGPTDENRTKNDLELLCLLRKLGIYVLPLTTTRDESIKSHFADLLTEYKVRCLDLGNLEVGQEQPSFFHHQHVTQVDRLSRLQGMECTQSNVPRVATYQILAVDQFCGIENKAIFQLLKRTRERQVIRDELKEELQRQQRRTSTDDDDMTTKKSNRDSYYTTTTSGDNSTNSSHISIKSTPDSSSGSSYFKTIIISFISAVILFLTYQHYYNTVQQPSYWTVSFDVDSSFVFTLSTRDANGKLSWSKVAPQVWLNHEYAIPVEKVDNEPGYYQLIFDPFNTTTTNEKFTSLVFSVNTSVTNLPIDEEHILYTSTNSISSVTYLILNSNHNNNRNNRHDSNDDVPVHQQQEEEIKDNDLQHKLNNQQKMRPDNIGILKKTWRTFVFISNNYSNLYKIIIKK